MIQLEVWSEKHMNMHPSEEDTLAFFNQSRLNNKYGVFARENKNEMEFLEAEADRREIE